MDASYHRHDIDDRSWDLIKDLLPGQRGQWGGIAEDNRRFIDGVFWVLRTGAPWRDLEPDFEWLMVDSTCVKVHRDGAGAVGGTEACGLTKGGRTPRYTWPWMRMVCRSDSLSRLVPRRIAGICRG